MSSSPFKSQLHSLPVMTIFALSKAAVHDPRIDIPRPVVDFLLAPALDALNFPEELDLNVLRAISVPAEGNPFVFTAEAIIKARPHLKHIEHSVVGPEGNTVILSVFSPREPASSSLPALYYIHGGGQVAGDRFAGVELGMNYTDGLDVIFVSVEYRLSPQARAPGPATDCYAGLVWTSENAVSLGIDPTKIIVMGISGGGPLAAVSCLMARDKSSPAIPIRGQMLLTPMLDDRCDSVSDKQFQYGTAWCGVTNIQAWKYVLGDDFGSDRVTPYQSPARATDLSNLPQTYIDAGECEVFRDPAVRYAMKMWECGSTCELHVWPGGFHGFDAMGDKNLPLVKAANGAKAAWIKRILES